jgi:hypothetical protein
MLAQDQSLDESTRKGLPKVQKLTDSRGLTFIDGDNEDSSDDDRISNNSRTDNGDDVYIDGGVGSYSSHNSSLLDTPKASDI